MLMVDEETAAREQDANDRYNNTNALTILFCRTEYADKGLDFLWSGLSADEQVTTSFVVEHIVLETLTIESCLSLSLVFDSWVTFHLLSVAIRNDGKRKKNKRPVADVEEESFESFSISNLQEEIDSQQVSIAEKRRLAEDRDDGSSTQRRRY
ncbi:hypothetical protein INT48_009868 [Thamnidium elegans]|uniref:Uncharacterized protein n=1 Tax=Thamnidium elegans TaxID=101142 RepID=A0A8H7SLE7_9FUNG|nr:hypothetical protein INT48_009868 [Thamnidium elegans]